MGGQVLGGGVIVAVAVALWLVYLLPSWHSRHQYAANERNAVRLSQALRVLAETSETPEEVHLELNARTARAQRRLAQRALSEREYADVESARIELAAARAMPAVRRARARRRARRMVGVVALVALAVTAWGVWLTVQTGTQILLWAGVAGTALCGLLLHRMARVNAKAIARVDVIVDPPVVARTAGPEIADVSLEEERQWTPRRLPAPLTAATGSRAAATLDTEDARRARNDAARAEQLRERAAQLRPSPADITAAREAKATAPDPHDDAQIEAHVRRLLADRAAG